MYLTLAESWAKKGQTAEAIASYEKAARLTPNSRVSDLAAAEIVKLRANGGAALTGGMKP
jgi:cytochrome c-type biogenesis protein CcmH/NrfG